MAITIVASLATAPVRGRRRRRPAPDSAPGGDPAALRRLPGDGSAADAGPLRDAVPAVPDPPAGPAGHAAAPPAGPQPAARRARQAVGAGAPPADEAAISERLSALQELEARSAAENRKAYTELDALLDPRQQARFRVFEEQIERRKLELMLRARQNVRQEPAPAPPAAAAVTARAAMRSAHGALE